MAERSSPWMLISLALAGVALGVSSAIIVLPHPVAPRDFPLPRMVPATRLSELAERDERALEQSVREPLPAAVRALGTAFVRLNEAAHAGAAPTGPEHERVHRELRGALADLRRALPQEAEFRAALGALRSVQTELFMRELDAVGAMPTATDRQPSVAWGRPGLVQLAGTLPEILRRNGWIRDSGRPIAPPEILRVRYKLFWTGVVWSLEDCEHVPAPVCYGATTLPLEDDELRVFFRYLLAHPVISVADARSSLARRRQTYLDRLAALDAFRGAPLMLDYGTAEARAINAYEMGQYPVAAALFQAAGRASPADMRPAHWRLAAIERAQ